MRKKDVVVLLSGGLDSTVAAASALAAGSLRACLCVRYGQPHMEAEMMAARKWCTDNVVERVLLDVNMPRVEAMHTGVGMAGPRVMPGRNLVLIAHAVQWAAANDCATVLIGACKDDAANYPDCRPKFVEAANALASVYGVEVRAPWLYHTKADVVEFARIFKVDIAATWSCYEPLAVGFGFAPCGTCDACRLRDAAVPRG